jgi:hypothetical protein
LLHKPGRRKAKGSDGMIGSYKNIRHKRSGDGPV